MKYKIITYDGGYRPLGTDYFNYSDDAIDRQAPIMIKNVSDAMLRDYADHAKIKLENQTKPNLILSEKMREHFSGVTDLFYDKNKLFTITVRQPKLFAIPEIKQKRVL